MSRIEHCAACNMQDNGVKTRIPLEHTCGREPGTISANQEARNEMDKKKGCKACRYERCNIKQSREPHTCGK